MALNTEVVFSADVKLPSGGVDAAVAVQLDRRVTCTIPVHRPRCLSPNRRRGCPLSSKEAAMRIKCSCGDGQQLSAQHEVTKRSCLRVLGS